MTDHIVYLTTNMITGEKYIGKHSNPKDWYLGSGTRLLRAINKYGKEAFVRETLSIHATEDEAYLAEQAEIEQRDAINSSQYYNIVRGGAGGGYERKLGPREPKLIRSGWSHTEETKLGMSKNHNPNSAWPKGTPRSDENRQNLSKAKTGWKMPESGKEKLRKLTGDKNSQFGSFWITDGIVNKKIKNIDSIPEGWYKGRVFKEGYNRVR